MIQTKKSSTKQNPRSGAIAKIDSAQAANKWAAQSQALFDLSDEQAQADLDLAVARRDASRAQATLDAAVVKAAAAERRLASARAKLGQD